MPGNSFRETKEIKMSELEDRLMEDYKTAMRAGEAQRKDTLRLLRSALKSAQIDKRAPLTEEEALDVLSRQAKQRRDAIELFAQGGRDDLVQAETAELVVIEEYLPAGLSREEVEELARSAIAEVGASGMREMGTVMKNLMPQIKGRADGKLVSDVVRILLGQQ